jgi:hypothetical protein
MATVTDLTGNENSQTDETSVQVGDDSNVNVYEFGNILLAGILPTLSSWLKDITDKIGNQLSATDKDGRTSWITPGPIIASEDEEEMTDEQGVELVMEGPDMPGVYSANSVVDMSGS